MAKQIRKLGNKYYYIDNSKFTLTYSFSATIKVYEVSFTENNETITRYIFYDNGNYDNVFNSKIGLFNFLIKFSTANNVNLNTHITWLLQYFPDEIKEIN